MKRRTGSFPAAVAAGRRYTVEVWVDKLPTEGFEGVSGSVDGFTYLITSTGQPLNRIDKGEYEMRLTGMRLISTDPAAP